MILNWFSRLLGLHDKEQKQRTQAVGEYADQKRVEFTKQMGQLKAQAKKVHNKQIQAHQETERLVLLVEDVTAQIMRATGGNSR